jgi:hypothetical protein
VWVSCAAIIYIYYYQYFVMCRSNPDENAATA